MLELRISLIHQSVLEVTCSMLLVKHIEGSLSAPELALNDAIGGRLRTAYERREKDDDIEVSSESQLPFASIYALNFHRGDLPFTYASVDSYARLILGVATRSRRGGQRSISTMATAVHGFHSRRMSHSTYILKTESAMTPKTYSPYLARWVTA